MMIIPGWLIGLFTFPGVIVHELAHLLFCRLFGATVLDVCYLNPKAMGGLVSKEPLGYVLHDRSKSFTATFFIATGPFLLNSALCYLLCLPALLPQFYFGREPDIFSIILLYMGVSIGMHAFPSTGDAQVLWAAAKHAVRSWHPLALLSFPLVGLIMVGNVARFIWADFFFALGVGPGLAALTLKWLMS